MEMRKVLAQELAKLMQKNKNIIIINADLAKAAGLSNLCDIFSERCFNVGVAEQNMAGVAAGLSAYGFIPFIFTFAPFATRRICDQIAVSVCYAEQNVKIFGMDPGIAAEANGGTHMSFEDVGVLRSIPNIVIFEPCDEIQFKKSINQITNYKGAVYVRMFRKETPVIFDNNYEFNLFGADLIREGGDVSIFCTGIMVAESLIAGEILKTKGIDAEIINIHAIKPIDEFSIIKSAKKTKRVITAENHNVSGGLFSAVSEVLSQNFPVPIRAVGIKDKFGQVGKMMLLKKHYHLMPENIVNKVMEII
jgi:transketolase